MTSVVSSEALDKGVRIPCEEKLDGKGLVQISSIETETVNPKWRELRAVPLLVEQGPQNKQENFQPYCPKTLLYVLSRHYTLTDQATSPIVSIVVPFLV